MAASVRVLAAPTPDFTAVTRTPAFGEIVGALLTYVLITAVLMIVTCSVTWALASAGGSWQAASKAKVGLFVALAGAALSGGALAWANWLLDLGATL